jgi:DNA-binding transcriptional ArsR family regulator
MNLSHDHKEIIRELARSEGPMSLTDLVAAVCLPNQRISKILFELAEDKGAPIVARVDIEEGVPGYKCVADAIFLETLLEEDEDIPVPASSAPASAPARTSSVVQLGVVAPRTNTAVAPVAAAKAAPVTPAATPAPFEMFGFLLGEDRTADTILRHLLKSPRTGSDLLEEIDAPGDVVTTALRALEDAALIITVDMDDDLYYRMSEALNAEELEELQMALNGITSYASDAFTPAPAATVRPAPVASPAPVDSLPANNVASDSELPASVDDSGDVGKVALRIAQQRKDSIAYIKSVLAKGPAPKLAISDGVVDIFTARGAKELLAELIQSGELEEFRESKTKYLRLSQAKASAKAPAAATSVSDAAPKTKAAAMGDRRVADVQPRVAPEIAPQAPAATVSHVEPTLEKERFAPVADEAPAPVSAPAKAAPSHVRENQDQPSERAGVNAFEQLMSSLPLESADSHYLVSNALTQLAGYVRQLETENKIYKDLFAKLGLRNVG